jgi:hypothetical protein
MFPTPLPDCETVWGPAYFRDEIDELAGKARDKEVGDPPPGWLLIRL